MSEIEMQPVSSSNIESIGYDEGTQILRVKYSKGGIYEYRNVPLVEYQQLISAASIGAYINRVIKGVYAYEKIG